MAQELTFLDSLDSRAKAAGLSMAEICRRAGIAQSTPARWRNGTFLPTIRTITKIDGILEEAEAARHEHGQLDGQDPSSIVTSTPAE